MSTNDKKAVAHIHDYDNVDKAITMTIKAIYTKNN